MDVYSPPITLLPRVLQLKLSGHFSSENALHCLVVFYKLLIMKVPVRPPILESPA